MSLSERLNDLLRTRTIIRSKRLPRDLQIQKSLDRLTEHFENVRPINQVDYDTLIANLREAARLRVLNTLSLREMRLAASCLFDGERCLADDPAFVDLYFDALRSIRSRGALKRLIHSYCVHFDPLRPSIARIGAFLREAAPAITGRWEWAERHRRYMLFDPAKAPQQLARLTADSARPRAELEGIGLGGQLLTGGLVTHVFLNALQIIQAKLEADPGVEEVECAMGWVLGDDGSLHFSAYRSALTAALLLPWDRMEPPQEVRDRIQGFLLEKLGDPRIDGGPWIGTNEVARDVMVRWLAQATLEQFLKVVDRTAAAHQWEYRRAFWNAYIEKRAVGNAWVAFASSGTQVARRLSESTGDPLMSRFGTLGGAGADQAVLLLRIGDLVVADWSHNGRLRIWRRGNPNAPQFNLKSYLAVELRTDSEFDTVHMPPDGWQARTEAFIRRHTGMRLSEAEFMPRRRSR